MASCSPTVCRQIGKPLKNDCRSLNHCLEWQRRIRAMWKRLTSLISIAAILACPLRCSLGGCESVCCANGGFAADTSSLDVAETTSPAAGCCSRTLQLKQEIASPSRGQNRPPLDSHAPVRRPTGSACQGICGGAVLEKPCEAPQTLRCLWLHLPLQAPDPLTLPWQARSVEVSHPSFCGFYNCGRATRVEQASLIC